MPCKSRTPRAFFHVHFPALTSICARYAEQVDKVNRLRDDTVRAIIKNSSEVVMFKEEVSKQLKQVHDFAEAN